MRWGNERSQRGTQSMAEDRARRSVCIIRHNYYPDTHVKRDAEALAQAGYDVTVVALRREGQSSREVLNGVRVLRMPVEHRRGSPLRYAWEYSAFTLIAFLQVTWLHLRRRFDVVEVDNMPDILIFTALVPKLTGTPVVFYVFDNMPELLAYLKGLSSRHPVVRALGWLEGLAYKLADHVLVTQELPKRLALSRGADPSKVTVVLNSADDNVFRRPEVVHKEEDVFRIVTHGSILERYGIQTLIEALPKIAREVPNVELQIFGKGEYEARLRELVARLGLGNKVKFRGFVELDELIATLASADVGYVGMLNDLVLPNKLMEYVALGVPVVISRWETFERYFPEGSVTYFEPGNPEDLARAIIQLSADPVRREQQVRWATELYSRYRWSEQKAVYLGVYEDLLASKARVATGLVGGEGDVG